MSTQSTVRKGGEISLAVSVPCLLDTIESTCEDCHFSLCVCVCVCVCVCSQPCLMLASPWTVAHQAPLSMRFSRARILERVAVFLLQGNLPNSGIEPESLASPPLAGRFFTTSTISEARRFTT